MEFTKSELDRYDRQITLPEFGLAGQEALRDASVLIVGCGGLGSPSALYLASAGIGRIGLVDFDTVDISNLHRQILFTEDDLGKSKAEVAAEKLGRINPHIEIETFNSRLSVSNVSYILKDYDYVLDGTDNFSTRYLINDACVMMGKINVHAAIYRFDGQLSVFGKKNHACYRCVFPEPPPPELVPSCAEAGVLGVLPGLLGTMQALELIKMVTGIGTPMLNQLVLVDTKTMSQRIISLERDPACPVCGDSPSIVNLEEVPEYCASPLNRLSIEEWRKFGEHHLLDVREIHEVEKVSLAGQHVPLGQIKQRLSEIPRDGKLVVHCATGRRSESAVKILVDQGWIEVYNLEGGLNAALREVKSDK